MIIKITVFLVLSLCIHCAFANSEDITPGQEFRELLLSLDNYQSQNFHKIVARFTEVDNGEEHVLEFERPTHSTFNGKEFCGTPILSWLQGSYILFDSLIFGSRLPDGAGLLHLNSLAPGWGTMDIAVRRLENGQLCLEPMKYSERSILYRYENKCAPISVEKFPSPENRFSGCDGLVPLD